MARPRTRVERSWSVVRAIVDAGALLGAATISGAAADDALGPRWDAALVVITLASLAALGGYRVRTSLSLTADLRNVLTATSFASLAVTTPALVISGRTGAGDAAIVNWLIATVLVGTGRLAVTAGQSAVRARRSAARRTLIVGAGVVGHLTARRLLDDPRLGMTPIGFLDKEPLYADSGAQGARSPLLPVLGASWDLDRVLNEQSVAQVIVAFSTAPHAVLLHVIRTCWRHNVPVMVVPRLYEVEGRRAAIEHVGGLPLVELRPSDPAGWQFRLKYAIDRVVAAILLLLLAPVLIATSLAVLVCLGRPLLFRQRRVGRDGREFEMLKFRTLRGSPTEPGAPWAAAIVGLEDGTDAIVPAPAAETRLGRFLRSSSIDELPQLWNVLRGDMSLIGPRPERTHYVDRFQNSIYRYPDRHRVKSGLTGWAQIHGLRGETSLRDRVEWDNFYIENWSFGLDLRIALMTLPALFGRRSRSRSTR